MASRISTSSETVTPWQNRRPRWRKNYMMVSLPPTCEDYYKVGTSLSTMDSGLSLTQSLHRKSRHELINNRQRKLIGLLTRCAESIEGMASLSYVASMRSCESGYELSTSALHHVQPSATDGPLICLDGDREPAVSNGQSGSCKVQPTRQPYMYVPHSDQYIHPRTQAACTNQTRPSNAEYLYKHNGIDNSVGLSDISCVESNDNCKVFLTPRLKIASSCYSSSYVRDSSEASFKTSIHAARTALSKSVDDQLIRDSAHSQSDYLSIVLNGKSTAFLSDDDNNTHSYYYDDEFEFEQSLTEGHDSHIQTVLCAQYASLLEMGNNRTTSEAGEATPSDLSSDFDNIFPASVSIKSEEGHTEESGLEVSVPNYSNMAAAKQDDYHFTFGGEESSCSEESSFASLPQDGIPLLECKHDSEPRHRCKPNQVPKPPRSNNHSSTKKVSFSDDIPNASHQEETVDSTTWLEMKQNYTTWGQVKVTKEEPRKSQSIPDMAAVERRRKRLGEEQDERKRYSLTLWEMYKRAHSMSLSVSDGELTTPEAYKEPTRANQVTEDAEQSVNDLLDNAIGSKAPQTRGYAQTQFVPLPDVSFLKNKKATLNENAWWADIFDQPSFCDGGSVAKACCHGELRDNDDDLIVVYHGLGSLPCKICHLSMFGQLLSPNHMCRCTREKLSDDSSGIATGSSGVTPREPSSWQHIADFLKKRQRNTDQAAVNRASLNTTLSDQQLIDVVSCIEAADKLSKYFGRSTHPEAMPIADTLLCIWRLASALECVLSLGLKSHKYVNVSMGKIRTRVTVWDVVEESCLSANQVTSIFSQILAQLSAFKVADISVKFCLFICGLLNFQCLDFWFQVVTHSHLLLEKFYDEAAFIRCKVPGDRKLNSEVTQALQPLSLYSWDINYKQMIGACVQSEGS